MLVKIAHVVTYISADGAFGGPVAVARGQAEELASRGHQVDLIAGWDGTVRVSVPGVTVRLFPVRRIGRGFSGTVSLPLLRFLWKHAWAYDIVHVHLARDLIALPVALMALSKRTPVAIQAHGMIKPDDRLAVKLVDLLATKRVLRGAVVAFALTKEEVGELRTVGRPESTTTVRVPNGIKGSSSLAERSLSSPPIVLFLARLHPRKRVMAFAQAAKILLERGIAALFIVIGPDEGDQAVLAEFIDRNKLVGALVYKGAIAPGEALDHLAGASIYVLPSQGEIFPMTVLEAMSVGTPVVLTDDCGISVELHERGAAVVTNGSPASLANAVQRLLDDDRHRAEVQAGAQSALSDWLSIERVADQLEAAYARALQ